MKVLFTSELVTTDYFDVFVRVARESFTHVLAVENSNEAPAGSDRKRTGCVTVLGNADGDLLAAIVLGELTPEQIAKYFGVAVEKMERTARAIKGVRTHPLNLTSFQTANPDNRQWGGGVRDEFSDTSIATSGLSAFGDEAVSCMTGHRMGRFNRDFVWGVMKISGNPYCASFVERTSTLTA